MKNFFFFLLLSGFSIAVLQSQTTTSATGGTAVGSGGSTSYTVGQIIYSTISGSNGTVYQGVQQPYEISVVTAIERAKEIDLICFAYPNPATDNLTLKIEDYDKGILVCKLYDISGKLMMDIKVKSSETFVPMQTLVAGTYILRIIDGISEKKTFKIIKK
jgi:hypothetical protein